MNCLIVEIYVNLSVLVLIDLSAGTTSNVAPRTETKYWQADGIFVPGKLGKNDQEEGEGGGWQLSDRLPPSWQLRYQSLRFLARPTPFRHLGFFPEQAAHWDWCADAVEPSLLITSIPQKS